MAQKKTYPCHYLADELKKRGWHQIDYMTIDTEGSELALIEDFPWNDFDIRVVQIEQLSEIRYAAQKGRKDKIIRHMESAGYKLLSVYPVATGDTDDIIMTRNVDHFLEQAPAHKYDGDYTKALRKSNTVGVGNNSPLQLPGVAGPRQGQPIDANKDSDGTCACSEPRGWTSQARQDEYIWHRVLRPQNLCCRGIYVEFGARNGIEHSNTYTMEKFQGWKGLLAEVDARENPNLKKNRPNADVIMGPFCPKSQDHVNIVMSKFGGWTGSEVGYGKGFLRIANKFVKEVDNFVSYPMFALNTRTIPT